MLFFLLLLLLQPQENDSVKNSCSLDVKFSSKNFINFLTWSMPNKREGVRYSVKYKVYGPNPWREKAECINITQNWCDLTNETNLLEEQYFGMVTIYSQACYTSNITERFNPLCDTELDPPILNLFLTSTSITINLTHVVDHLDSIEDWLKYEINISGKGTIVTEEPYHKEQHLDPDTTYCVSARLLRQGVNSNFSNKTCVTTKKDKTSEDKVHILLYILGVTLVVFIVFGAGYAVHKYIHVNNLQQPQFLNITSNNNNNVVLVDANNITINVIKIESGKSNEQSTMTDDKEEKTEVKKDLNFTDDGYSTSQSSELTENDDHGYVSLVEQPSPTRPQMSPTRPQMSPYDMPHNLSQAPAKLLTAPSVIAEKEEDLYGRIKCNSNGASIPEESTVEAHQKADTAGEAFTYLLKNDQHFPQLDVLIHELDETETYSIGQDADTMDMAEGTYFSESDTLFVDWSPTSHHLYIPNFHTKTVDKAGAQECLEKEGLLSYLYKPTEIEETSEELTCLEQKWELHVNMQE